jgi:cysteinyl-tRNA synthetase, unknown class
MKKVILFIMVMFFLSTCVSNLTLPKIDKSWLYQLSDADIDSVIEAGFNLIVMDYSYDGTDENKYTPAEIASLKDNGITPICYISIGEAESYRFYWDTDWETNKPEWLGNENPDWEGNYKVRFWYNDWKYIIYSYLDEIIDQGFSGIYLDIIDAFEYWADDENYEGLVLTEEDSATRMISFVSDIADYCRSAVPGFTVFPQNGENILTYDTTDMYKIAVSGIGIEDLWYDETSEQDETFTNQRISHIDVLKDLDKTVLVVDYVDNGKGYDNKSNVDRIYDYITKCNQKQYHCYIAYMDRDLDEINKIDGVQP